MPTDFGTAAEAALTHGRELSRTFGASLHLLHVLENLFLRATAAHPRRLEAAALLRLLNCLGPTTTGGSCVRVASLKRPTTRPTASLPTLGRRTST